jgi:hypothetical protein
MNCNIKKMVEIAKEIMTKAKRESCHTMNQGDGRI